MSLITIKMTTQMIIATVMNNAEEKPNILPKINKKCS